MNELVSRIKEYHLPEGEVLAPVAPIKPVPYRLVPVTEQNAAVLAEVGHALYRLGADASGKVLLDLAKAWAEA